MVDVFKNLIFTYFPIMNTSEKLKFHRQVLFYHTSLSAKKFDDGFSCLQSCETLKETFYLALAINSRDFIRLKQSSITFS